MQHVGERILDALCKGRSIVREGQSLASSRMQLAGETVTLDIPVNPIGRATLPMLKQAFEEDAVLRLNRQNSNFRFSGRFSISEKSNCFKTSVDHFFHSRKVVRPWF